MGIPAEAWNLPVTLLFPKCSPSPQESGRGSILEPPGRPQVPICIGGAHFTETSLHPSCEFRLPPGLGRAQFRHSYSAVTHRPPLPLIPFLFGFNEPNPLVSPGRQGAAIERAVVWGEPGGWHYVLDEGFPRTGISFTSPDSPGVGEGPLPTAQTWTPA